MSSPLGGSPDEARLCTRQQLLPGASQIKVEAGGGVASARSALDASTFTDQALSAAAHATGNWGTWVGVHACRPQGPSTAPSGIALAAARRPQAANCCR
jgi:imidazolonepropionase-like amidohydrolase